MNNPKVSVCVVTYNQEKYIEECLLSIVNQDVDFDFEVIVGDDCSTDKTSEIIRKYTKNYPNLIIPIYHTKNVGTVQNIISSYQLARGDYIAHMDGDDIMLPNKLLKQKKVLDNNPQVIMSTHNANVIDINSDVISNSFRNHRKEINNLLDLYYQLPFFIHSSKMFRNEFEKSFWEQFSSTSLDVEVHIEQANYGNIHHSNECLGSYRIFSGISRENNKVNDSIPIGVERIFKKALNSNKFDSELIRTFYAKAMLEFSYQSAIFGDNEGVVRFIKKSHGIMRISITQEVFYRLRYLPSIIVYCSKLRQKLKHMFKKTEC